mgnify:FL=1
MGQHRLHADHIDTTGAYGRKFEVIKELYDSGTLTELPPEFRAQTEVVEVVATPKFNFYDEKGNQHADHVDETGEYRRAWEEQFGPLNNFWVGPEENIKQNTNTEWKSFLQTLIAEEKAKLNI